MYVLMRWVVGVVPKLKLTPLTFLRLFHSRGLFHPGVMNHSKNRNGWKVSLYFVKWEDCERSLGEGKKQTNSLTTGLQAYSEASHFQWGELNGSGRDWEAFFLKLCILEHVPLKSLHVPQGYTSMCLKTIEISGYQQGWFCCPGYIWQCLERVLVVIGHLVDRDQRCY